MGWYTTCEICNKEFKYCVECGCQEKLVEEFDNIDSKNIVEKKKNFYIFGPFEMCDVYYKVLNDNGEESYYLYQDDQLEHVDGFGGQLLSKISKENYDRVEDNEIMFRLYMKYDENVTKIYGVHWLKEVDHCFVLINSAKVIQKKWRSYKKISN